MFLKSHCPGLSSRETNTLRVRSKLRREVGGLGTRSPWLWSHFDHLANPFLL